MRVLAVAVMAASLACAQHEAPAGGAPSHGDKSGHATGEKHDGGGGHAAMPNEIWWKWANFALLAGVLGYLINKNAGPYFRAKSDEISQGIAGAAAMKADAEARAGAIEKKIADLSGEVEKMRRAAREEMDAEGARIRRETEQAIDKLRAQSQADIASAAKAAKQELKAYSADLALQLAEQKIQQQMNADTQNRLADGFVDDLKRKAAMN